MGETVEDEEVVEVNTDSVWAALQGVAIGAHLDADYARRLADYVNRRRNDNDQCYNCGQTLSCENCGR